MRRFLNVVLFGFSGCLACGVNPGSGDDPSTGALYSTCGGSDPSTEPAYTVNYVADAMTPAQFSEAGCAPTDRSTGVDSHTADASAVWISDSNYELGGYIRLFFKARIFDNSTGNPFCNDLDGYAIDDIFTARSSSTSLSSFSLEPKTHLQWNNASGSARKPYNETSFPRVMSMTDGKTYFFSSYADKGIFVTEEDNPSGIFVDTEVSSCQSQTCNFSLDNSEPILTSQDLTTSSGVDYTKYGLNGSIGSLFIASDKRYFYVGGKLSGDTVPGAIYAYVAHEASPLSWSFVGRVVGDDTSENKGDWAYRPAGVLLKRNGDPGAGVPECFTMFYHGHPFGVKYASSQDGIHFGAPSVLNHADGTKVCTGGGPDLVETSYGERLFCDNLDATYTSAIKMYTINVLR